MSWIFLSYSTKDRPRAVEVRERLKSRGYEALFIDFENIVAGRDWRKVLSHKLRHCGAAVLLCSEHSLRSEWCMAEVGHVLSMDKPLFPVKIAPCDLGGVVGTIQAVDLTGGDPEAEYERLWKGLEQKGLYPHDSFAWDDSRPPYPGLAAFQAKDAGVYFGRDDKISDVRRKLDEMPGNRRAPRLLVVAGPSGSGKSSLVRAGVLPRLTKLDEDRRRWDVRSPLRPGDDLPASLGRPRSGSNGQATLHVIDQFEEFLVAPAGSKEARFLERLRTALDRGDGRVLALATLRVDCLDPFLRHPAFLKLEPEPAYVMLPPLAPEDFVPLIEGPAAWADIDFDDGLVQKLVDDAATEDALPLLAFVLRELYESRPRTTNPRFTRQAYDRLGGLEGALVRRADDLLTSLALDDASRNTLRRAFLRLVQVHDDGSFVRQTVDWDDLPAEIRPTLERFVDARLLTLDGTGSRPTVRVVHDALFRAWPTLNRWLDEDHAFLLWRRRLRYEVRDWSSQQSPDGLLLRDDRLVEARRWRNRYGDLLDPDEREFVDRSSKREEWDAEADRLRREREIQQLQARAEAEAKAAREAEGRADDNRKAVARQRGFTWLVAVVAAGAFLGAFVAWQSRNTAVRERQRAEKNEGIAKEKTKQAELAAENARRQTRIAFVQRLAAQSGEVANHYPQRRLLLAAEAARIHLNRGEVLDAMAEQALHDAVGWTQGFGLTGHDSEILHVAWGPGKRLATASEDGQVRVWDLKSLATPPLVLHSHSSHVTGLAFGPASRLAASYLAGETLIWDLEKPENPAFVFPSDESPSLSMAWASSGRIAIGSHKGLVHVWDPSRPDSPPLVLHGHQGPINALAFGPAGQLATASSDATVRIWDILQPNASHSVLKGHESSVIALEFGPEGQLVTGSFDGELRIWHLPHPETPPLLFKGDGGILNALAFSPDGPLAAAFSDGTTRVWDPSRPNMPPLILREGGGEAKDLAWSPDGRLVTASSDGALRVWDLSRPNAPLLTLRGHEGEVLGLRFGPEGLLASASKDRTVRVWEPSRPDTPPLTLRGHTSRVVCLTWSPEGQLASGSTDETALVWEPSRPDTPPLTLRGHEIAIVALRFGPNNQLATASSDKTARVWNPSRGDVPPVLLVHPEPLTALIWTPDGRLVTGCSDGTVRVWDLSGHDVPLMMLRGGGARISDLAWGPDGRLATVNSDGIVEVWDLVHPDGPLEIREYERDATTFALGPDNRLAAGFRDGSVNVWRIDRTDTPRAIRGHDDSINALAFGPNGRLATGSINGTTQIWDLARTDAPPLSLRQDENGIRTIAWGPGSQLATGSLDGTVRVWELDPAVLLRHASRRAGRNLSPTTEWPRYFGSEPYRETFPGLFVPK